MGFRVQVTFEVEVYNSECGAHEFEVLEQALFHIRSNIGARDPYPSCMTTAVITGPDYSYQKRVTWQVVRLPDKTFTSGFTVESREILKRCLDEDRKRDAEHRKREQNT